MPRASRRWSGGRVGPVRRRALAGLSLPVAVWGVAAVLACLVAPAVAALPTGCTMTGTELTSCTGFTGGATLDLRSLGITSVAPGAFAGLTSVTLL